RGPPVPRAGPEDDARPGHGGRGRGRRQAGLAMSSLVMLVAGDELMSRTLGTQMTDLGYRFTRAGGSREARQLAAHALPAIIIVDLNSVPRGMELLASLDGTEPPFVPL